MCKVGGINGAGQVNSSTNFQIIKILFVQISSKRYKFDPNGAKMAIFSEKSQKITQQLSASLSDLSM